MELKKCFLRQILCLGDIANHAEAERVDASFVERVELGKRLMVAGLGEGEDFRIRRSRLRGTAVLLDRDWGMPNFLVPVGFSYGSFGWLLLKPGTWHALPWGIGIGSTAWAGMLRQASFLVSIKCSGIKP